MDRQNRPQKTETAFALPPPRKTVPDRYALLMRVLLCLIVLSSIITSQPLAAQAVRAATLPAPAKATMTLAKFLQQGSPKKSSPLQHFVVARPHQPASQANVPATKPLPSAEPVKMQPLSTVLVTSGHANAATAQTSAPLDLKGSDGRLELLIPRGSLDFSHVTTDAKSAPTGPFSFKITQVHGHLIGTSSVLGTYRFQVTDSQGHVVHGVRLSQPATVLYHYQTDELDGLNLNPNGIVWSWTDALNQARAAKQSTNGLSVPFTNNAKTHTLSAQTTIIDAVTATASGDPQIQQPPTPHLASVSGNSGQLAYSYPLQVPPGPVGFAPKLVLSYSSESINERYSNTTPADNPGEGWSLTLGSISAEQFNSDSAGGKKTWYSISSVGNVSDRLIPGSQSNSYVTEHLSYLRIQMTNNCFHVWDTSGSYYELGCTSDSLQYADNGNGKKNYRWDVNLIQAPFESTHQIKTILFSYLQDKNTKNGNTSIRDAAVKQITYGVASSVGASKLDLVDGTIDFHYLAPRSNGQWADSYGTNQNCSSSPPRDTTLRCDDPLDRGSMLAPDVMSTLTLDSISSYIGNDSGDGQTSFPAYQYTFKYQNIPFRSTTDPISGNDIYAAGEHLLRSVTPTVYQNGNAITRRPLQLHYTLSGLVNSYYDGNNNYSAKTQWRYLDNYIDEQTGSGGTVTYLTAYPNTHGTPNKNGDTRYDPFYCNYYSSDCSGKYNHPDEYAWTTQAVASLTMSGKDSSSSNLASTTTTYDYSLTYINSNCPNADSDTDCVGDTWTPSNNGSKDNDWQDYYHSEYRGFATVYITTAAGNLTSDHYYTTRGRFTPGVKSGNYNTGQVYEEDIYQGNQENDSALLKQTLNTYAGEGPHNACRSDLDQIFGACERILVTSKTIFYEGTGTSNTNAPWVQTDNYYDDYTNSGGLTSTSGVYHNLTETDISSSNAPTVIKKFRYLITDETDNGITYYNVKQVARSEIDDSSGHVWQCSKTFYDEGRPGGVPAPAAGWPTTQFSYSDCSNQTQSVLKSYTGYDLYGNAVATVDAFGVANPGIYANSGCTLQTAPAYMVSGWTAGHYTTCTTYDQYQAQPVSTQNALAQLTSISYDYGQTALPISTTDANGQKTTLSYSYASSGDRAIQTLLPGGTGSFTKQSSEFGTCSDPQHSLPCYEIDSLSALYPNTVSRTFYDSQGRAVETRTPLDGTHDTITFTVYDESNNSVFKSLPFRVASGSGWLDPNGATDDSGATPGGTASYADALGRTIATKDPLIGSSSEPGITCAGLTGTWTSCVSYGLGSPHGSSTVYSYAATLDANNHLGVAFSDSLENARFTQLYSQSGSITSNITTEHETQYNALNKPTAVIVTDLAPQPGQSITSVTTTASYDDMGRLVTLNDPDRGTHNYSYDADGRLLTDVSGSRTIGTSYDLLGRSICVQDAVPTTDGSGNCRSGSHPLVQNTYDQSKLGSVGSSDFPIGQLTQSIATTYYPDGTSTATTEQFQHDQRGQSITQTLQLTLPASWNVITALPTYQMTQAYNDAKQQTTTQTTVGGQPGYTFTQVYDSAIGQLTGLSNNSTGTATLATLSYNAQAQVSDVNFLGSTSTPLADLHFTYDGDLRPTGSSTTWQSSSGGTGTIFSDALAYDAVGNVISRATTHASINRQSNSGGSETQNFCYDEQNRLLWAGNSGTQPAVGNGTCGSTALSNTLGGNDYSTSYAYTHLGQLWQAPLNGVGATLQDLYCNSNHPHQLSGLYPTGTTCSNLSSASYNASYDAFGNLISRTYNGMTATLSYDTLDRLSQWNAGSTNQTWYAYDASGQRVLQRGTTSGTTMTIYAFGLEEHVYDGSGNHQSDTFYYPLNKRLIGALTSTGTQFYLTDTLGSVVSTFSNMAGSAAILGNQTYGPYGNQRYSTGSMGTTKGYTGQYADTTGLDYYNARYYDPVIGRFVSADTVDSNIKGMDPYAYVEGNPETKVDPTGHDGIDLSGLLQWFNSLDPISKAEITAAGAAAAPELIGAGVVAFLLFGLSGDAPIPDAAAATPVSVGAWDAPKRQGEATQAQTLANSARAAAIAAVAGKTLAPSQDPNKSNAAGARLEIQDSSGHTTQLEDTALGYQQADLSDHAEPQLVRWAQGEIAAIASQKTITNVNLMLYTGKAPCKLSCRPLLFGNIWLKQLWGAIGSQPGAPWLHFHVWSGGIPENPVFSEWYSRSYNGTTILQWR